MRFLKALNLKLLVEKHYVVAKPATEPEPLEAGYEKPRQTKIPPGAPIVESEKTWIEVLLLDENEQPEPDKRYRSTDDYGAVLSEGTTNAEGLVRVDEIEVGTYYVGFPDLDRALWKKL